MHRYEIKDNDALIYLNDELVAYAKHWDSVEGAEDWAKAMVADLDYKLANPELADD